MSFDVNKLIEYENRGDPAWLAVQAARNKQAFILDAIAQGACTVERATEMAASQDDLDWSGVTAYPVYSYDSFVRAAEHEYHRTHYIMDETDPESVAYWTHGKGNWLGPDGGACEDLAALPAIEGDPDDLAVEAEIEIVVANDGECPCEEDRYCGPDFASMPAGEGHPYWEFDKRLEAVIEMIEANGVDSYKGDCDDWDDGKFWCHYPGDSFMAWWEWYKEMQESGQIPYDDDADDYYCWYDDGEYIPDLLLEEQVARAGG